MILWLLSLLSVKGHRDQVNSVTFDNTIDTILSGSKDGTVRKWQATPDHILCKALNWQRFCLHHEAILFGEDKASNPDEIEVIKLRSDNNASREFAFIGFDSGRASNLNIQTYREETLIDNQDSSNRILDIALSPDLKTIYLGRGTRLLRCNLEERCDTNNGSNNLIKPKKSIHALTLTPDHKSILAGGQENDIFMVELDGNNKVSNFNRLHPPINKESDQITGLKFTENNILVSADNRGLLQIWNFNECSNGKCKLLYSNKSDQKPQELGKGK